MYFELGGSENMTILVNIMILEMDEGYYILAPSGCGRFLFVSISNDCPVNNHRYLHSFIQHHLSIKTIE